MALIRSLQRQTRRRLRHAVTGSITRLRRRRQNQATATATDAAPTDRSEDGVIRQQTASLHLPADLIDSGADVSDARVSIVVIVVVIASLLFIGLVTWAISLT